MLAILHHLLTLVILACAGAAGYCILLVFRSTIKVVSARKDGVPLFRAMTGTNILRKPDLYKPEARKWAERYFWGFIGGALFGFAAIWLAMLQQWLAGEPIGFR